MLLQHCEIELVHNKMEERYVNAKTIPGQGVNSSHTKRILEPEQFPATSNFVQWWKTKSLTRSFKLYSLCLQQAALGRDYYENR